MKVAQLTPPRPCNLPAAGHCVARGPHNHLRRPVIASAQKVADASVSYYENKRKRRLSELIASLNTIERSYEELRSAFDVSAPSSSSSSEPEQDESAAGMELFGRSSIPESGFHVTVSEPEAPPSVSSVRLGSNLDVGSALDYSGNGVDRDRTTSAAAQQLRVCTGKSCRKRGSEDVLKAAQLAGASSGVDVQKCKCLDKCKEGPNIQVLSGKQSSIRTGVQLADVPELVDW